MVNGSRQEYTRDDFVAERRGEWSRGSLLPSSTTDFGQSELDTPDLTLVAQTVFTDDLQLGVARFRERRMLEELSQT